MTDVSQLAQILAAGMMRQNPPQLPPMMADQGLGAMNWQSLLHAPGDRPGGAIQTIDPGVLWGGRDKNAVRPDDYMTNKYFGIGGENT